MKRRTAAKTKMTMKTKTKIKTKMKTKLKTKKTETKKKVKAKVRLSQRETTMGKKVKMMERKWRCRTNRKVPAVRAARKANQPKALRSAKTRLMMTLKLTRSSSVQDCALKRSLLEVETVIGIKID